MGADISSMKESNRSTQRKTCQVMEISSKKLWKAHFDASRESDKLMVIDFTATWCGPCKLMEPTIKQFAAKYTDVGFIKIDVDVLMEVAEEFEVDAMPTCVLIKKGKEVDRIVGAMGNELERKIEKHRTRINNS